MSFVATLCSACTICYCPYLHHIHHPDHVLHHFLAHPWPLPPLHAFLGLPLEVSLSQLNAVNIHPVREPPPFLPNDDIIPAHRPLLHPPVRGKSPVLDAVAPLPHHPLPRIPVLVPELHRDPVRFGPGQRKQLLAQPVVLFPPPFRRQKGFYLGAAAQEGRAVAPEGGAGVGLAYQGRVARVPEALGGFYFLVGGLGGEGGGVVGHLSSGRGGRQLDWWWWTSWTALGCEGLGGDVFG